MNGIGRAHVGQDVKGIAVEYVSPCPVVIRVCWSILEHDLLSRTVSKIN